MCRGDGTNTIQLVQTLPQGTGADGIEAKHEGVATSHCEMDSRQVLHRFGNVVTLLATFFRLYHTLSCVICTSLHKAEIAVPRCCNFANAFDQLHYV